MSGHGLELLRPLCGEGCGVGLIRVRGGCEACQGDRDGDVPASRKGGRALCSVSENGGGRLIEKRTDLHLRGGWDEGGESHFHRSAAVRLQTLDEVSGRPFPVLDGAVVESAVGGCLDLEKAAVFLQIGEGFRVALEGGFQSGDLDPIQLEGARQILGRLVELEGRVIALLGQGGRFAREGDGESPLLVEDFHAQGEFRVFHGILLLLEDDLLGVLGDVVRLVHLEELLEFLLFRGQQLLAALERLGGGFLGGLAAGLREIGELFGSLFGVALEPCELLGNGLLQRRKVQLRLGEGQGFGVQRPAGVGDLAGYALRVENDKRIALFHGAAVCHDADDAEIRPNLRIQGDGAAIDGKHGGAEAVGDGKRFHFQSEFPRVGGGGDECRDDLEDSGHCGGGEGKHGACPDSSDTSRFAGQPNRHEPRLLRHRHGRHEMLDDLVALALQVAGEVRNLSRGSDGEQAAGLERLVGRGEPVLVVHQEALLSPKGRGIEVDQDRMQAAGLLVEGVRAGVALDDDARIAQRGFREKFPVPFRQFAAALRNGIDGAFLRQLADDGLQHVAEAQADDPDARLPGGAERGGGEFRKLLVGRARGRAADLQAVDVEVTAAVVLLEFQDTSVC